MGWGVVKKMSLRSHLENKAAVPPSLVPLLLLVWVWGLGRNCMVYTGCVGLRVIRKEDTLAKVRKSR